MIHLAMMVKNEPNIDITVESVKDIVEHVFIEDTGSTDDCKKQYNVLIDKYKHLKFHIIEREFVDFAVTRNALLDYIDETIPEQGYVIFLDGNEYVRVKEPFMQLVTAMGTDVHVYCVDAQWEGKSNVGYTKFLLTRTHSNLRYKGCVHEYIDVDSDMIIYKLENVQIIKMVTEEEENKTADRIFNRDIDMLKRDLELGLHPARSYYFLGKTYRQSSRHDEAIEAFEERIKLGTSVNREETYTTYMELANLYVSKQPDKAIRYWMHAYDILQFTEPLFFLASYMHDQKMYKIAYNFMNMSNGNYKVPSISEYNPKIKEAWDNLYKNLCVLNGDFIKAKMPALDMYMHNCTIVMSGNASYSADIEYDINSYDNVKNNDSIMNCIRLAKHASKLINNVVLVCNIKLPIIMEGILCINPDLYKSFINECSSIKTLIVRESMGNVVDKPYINEYILILDKYNDAQKRYNYSNFSKRIRIVLRTNAHKNILLQQNAMYATIPIHVIPYSPSVESCGNITSSVYEYKKGNKLDPIPISVMDNLVSGVLVVHNDSEIMGGIECSKYDTKNKYTINIKKSKMYYSRYLWSNAIKLYITK